MEKIEIKSHIDGNVLFSLKKENNTVKDTVEEAVKQHVSLYGADLRGADLHGAILRGADLRGANLCCADTSGANLCNADLRGADLHGAILCNSNLCNADLCCADLRGANLCCADTSGANLCGANLCDANLCCADLRGANLFHADLMCANLNYAQLNGTDLNQARLDHVTVQWCDMQGATIIGSSLKEANFVKAEKVPYYPMFCPSDGAFVGWKKVTVRVEGHLLVYLVKLRIPEDARRCSGTSMKCRCDKAEVLEIIDIETGEHVDEVTNEAYCGCTYKVGEMVYPDSFDDNRWKECSNGIHFFINKQDALDY